MFITILKITAIIWIAGITFCFIYGIVDYMTKNKRRTHGYWIKGGYACGDYEWTCSVCGNHEWRNSKTRYCSNCGSRMDESEDVK